MVPAPNGLNKAPKPKPSEPAPMTGVIHIGHDISKIERAESRGDRIEKGEKRSYFSLEEEFGPERFFDRESSWLDFNTRVLELAEDPNLFLLERLNFLSIVASNLDEFFMVRVAGLKRRIATGLAVPSAAGLSPEEQMEEIAERAHQLQTRHADVFHNQVLPALEEQNIRIVGWNDLDTDAKQRLRQEFMQDIFPILTPLAVDPAHPFALFPETTEIYGRRREALLAWYGARMEAEERFRREQPALAAKLDRFLSGEMPEIDYAAIAMKRDTATRAASAAMLALYAEQVENMVVSSADLSNSDKTDGFLKHTHAFTKGDFTGQFLQMGVSELTMACVMNGMALHGGILPVCGTFFVFSDYMKPAVRLAALMELHVVYVWTHDSFRVGEDGPTHQPIEHEAQIRLMEHLRNHSGHRSMLVLRPADADETVYAWKMALESYRPTALLLSRQNITSLPAASGDRRAEARRIEQGGYVVMDTEGTPDIVLVASGSEVSTLVEGAELLAADGICARVVSVPSEGLFRDQDADYQRSVLPAGVRRFGLTSGLPVTLEGLVGEGGLVHGLSSFGYSAPYKVLDRKFGFTGERVSELVKKFLGK